MRYPRSRSGRWLVASLTAGLLLAGIAGPATAHPGTDPASGQRSVDPGTSTAKSPNPGAAKRGTRTIQILNVSDFHGQLDPLSVQVGNVNVNVGGAAALATYFRQERAANPDTLLFTSGDAVGASPPLSSFFQDRPTIQWMNQVGFTADTLGNHNFDFGLERLQSQIDLAKFDYLSANLDIPKGELRGVRPYQIYNVRGVKVAVIGLTNPEAPEIVSPGAFGGITITDPVEAAQKARAEALEKGARVFILLPHMGVTNIEDGVASGPLIDLAKELDGFDLILGDHTNVEFAGYINGALVTENRSKGRTYSKVELEINPHPRGGGVSRSSVEFVTPWSDQVTPDPAVLKLLAPYRAELAEALDGVIGVATGLFPRGGTPAVERVAENALGSLIADALRVTYDTDLGFITGGGVRSTLPSNYLPQDQTLRRATTGYAAGPPYDLVKGDAYEVLPFGNAAVTRSITGSQLWAMLEHGVSSMPAASGKFPQISGFRFTYDVALTPGSRVLSVTRPDGTTPIPKDATTYTLATFDFYNTGGDGYAMLADGQGVTRDLDATLLLEYIQELGTVAPEIDGRIARLN
jgi:5'-nucleotidase